MPSVWVPFLKLGRSNWPPDGLACRFDTTLTSGKQTLSKPVGFVLLGELSFKCILQRLIFPSVSELFICGCFASILRIIEMNQARFAAFATKASPPMRNPRLDVNDQTCSGR